MLSTPSSFLKHISYSSAGFAFTYLYHYQHRWDLGSLTWVWPLQSQVLDKSCYKQQQPIWYNSFHVIRTPLSAFHSYRAYSGCIGVGLLLCWQCWVLEPVMPGCWGRFQGGVAVCCCTDWPCWEMGTDLSRLKGWHRVTWVCKKWFLSSLGMQI